MLQKYLSFQIQVGGAGYFDRDDLGLIFVFNEITWKVTQRLRQKQVIQCVTALRNVRDQRNILAEDDIRGLGWLWRAFYRDDQRTHQQQAEKGITYLYVPE